MENSISVSIIIVSWNVKEYLEKCIASIQPFAQAHACEVIVVDNCSSDGSVAWLEQNAQSCVLIKSEKNIGFGPANNLGIRIAKGRYIFLLNPDTIVIDTAIESMLAFLEGNPGAGCVGAKLLNPDRSLQTSSYPFPTVGREFWRLFHLDRIKKISQYPSKTWDSKQPVSVDVLQGAAIMIPRNVLDRAGFFDEGFFMYTEEVDLCYRIKKNGFLNYWLPDAEIIHFGGQSTQQAALPMFLELYASKVRFIRKYHHEIGAILYKFVLIAASAVRVLGSLFASKPGGKAIRSNYRALLRSVVRM